MKSQQSIQDIYNLLVFGMTNLSLGLRLTKAKELYMVKVEKGYTISSSSTTRQARKLFMEILGAHPQSTMLLRQKKYSLCAVSQISFSFSFFIYRRLVFILQFWESFAPLFNASLFPPQNGRVHALSN